MAEFGRKVPEREAWSVALATNNGQIWGRARGGVVVKDVQFFQFGGRTDTGKITRMLKRTRFLVYTNGS